MVVEGIYSGMGWDGMEWATWSGIARVVLCFELNLAWEVGRAGGGGGWEESKGDGETGREIMREKDGRWGDRE